MNIYALIEIEPDILCGEKVTFLAELIKKNGEYFWEQKRSVGGFIMYDVFVKSGDKHEWFYEKQFFVSVIDSDFDKVHKND